MSTIQPNSSIGEAPLKTGTSFSRPAALIGGATALIALTAIATTLAVKSPSRSDAAAEGAAAAVAAQSLNTTTANEPSADAPAKNGKSGEDAVADKPAPVRSAQGGDQQHKSARAPRHVTQAPIHETPSHATPSQHAAVATCDSCGVIEAVTPFQQKGEGSGIGAVAGGVLGGVLGHQVGGGSGKKAMTVIGAVGGGMAGHEIEKRQRATTLYSVKVRMDDGSLRTLTQSTAPTVGQKVTIEGQQLKARA